MIDANGDQIDEVQMMMNELYIDVSEYQHHQWNRWTYEETMLTVTMMNLRFNYDEISRAIGRSKTSIFTKSYQLFSEYPGLLNDRPKCPSRGLEPAEETYGKFISGLTFLHETDGTKYYKDKATGRYYGFSQDKYWSCSALECPNCHHHVPKNSDDLLSGFCSGMCHSETFESMKKILFEGQIDGQGRYVAERRKRVT